MSEGGLHVVFGTGQVGLALADRLAGLGAEVRAVSRRRPAALPDSVDWRGADAIDLDAAADAAKGASVVYQCLNAPYTRWPELFPPLHRGVLAAAERAGALLVTLENVYAYGPTGGRPMTEDLPLAATTSKGRTRAAMTGELLAASAAGGARVAIGRASDFFGAGALATLGTDERAVGQVWHLPGPETMTTRALLDLVAAQVGRPVVVRNVPPLVLRAMGLASPLMRGLAEMAYEFEEPFILDTAKFESAFGTAVTPLAIAVADTVAWYRTQAGAQGT